METAKNSKCQCRSKEWTHVFGWTQIIVFTLGTVFLMAIACIYTDVGPRIDQMPKNEFPTTEFWIVLTYCMVEVILGVSLLIGNKNDHPTLLLLWTNARSISAALAFVGGIYETIDGDGTPFLVALLYAVLSALLVCVVDHRMHDIEMDLKSTSVGASC